MFWINVQFRILLETEFDINRNTSNETEFDALCVSIEAFQ